MTKMKEFCITYREEFIIIVNAEDKEDAIKRVNKGEGKIELLGELWNDFMIIEEEGVDYYNDN
jgi:hypothetical protein